jgi:hypothetical protein
MKTRLIRLVCFLTALLALATLARAQGSAFTYQGRLAESGTPVSGVHDVEFRLFTTVSGAVQVGPALIAKDLALSNGLFTTTLDFGAAVFPGADRFLQIAVRPGASTGAYTNLTPRQPITSAAVSARRCWRTTR